MKRLLIALVLVGMCWQTQQGCRAIEGKEARVQVLAEKKLDDYKAANPNVPITDDIRLKFQKEANEQVSAEIQRDREAAAQKALEIAENVTTGNYVAGGLGILGLLGLGLGIWKKSKGGK